VGCLRCTVQHPDVVRIEPKASSGVPRVLCGDFNTPRRELPDGEVITWAQTEAGRLRRTRGARWDAAERDVIEGLAALDLPDVYRQLHGNGPQTASWVQKRSATRTERRCDHVFATPSLRASAFDYRYEWREAASATIPRPRCSSIPTFVAMPAMLAAALRGGSLDEPNGQQFVHRQGCSRGWRRRRRSRRGADAARLGARGISRISCHSAHSRSPTYRTSPASTSWSVRRRPSRSSCPRARPATSRGETRRCPPTGWSKHACPAPRCSTWFAPTMAALAICAVTAAATRQATSNPPPAPTSPDD